MLTITPLQPRHRRSTHIASTLRSLIASGQLKAGDKLPTESSLCEQFAVSRTTLREAIQTLRASGLLEVTPGRGSFVRSPNLQQLLADVTLTAPHTPESQLHTSQSLLALQKITLALLAAAPQPPHAHKLSLYMVRADAPAPDNAHTEGLWHTAMAELTGNPVHTLLVHTVSALHQRARAQRLRFPPEVIRTLQTQQQILLALTSHNFTTAESLLTTHLQPSSHSQAA